MADLLECLIQIKALGETLERAMVACSISSRTPAETESVTISGLWRELAEAERRYTAALATTGGAALDVQMQGGGTASHREEFIARRLANLERLNHYSAVELAGPVEWPGRPSTTVADLVAIMLANDTDLLGHSRRAGASP